VYELEDLNYTPIHGQFYQVQLTPVRITIWTTYKDDKILTKESTWHSRMCRPLARLGAGL